MAVTQAGLEESFSRIREDVTNKDLIAKCLSLCQRFSLSAGDLTNLWESFAINHDGSKFEMSSWGGFESEVVKAKSSVSMNSNVMSTPSSRRASSSRSNSSSIVTPRSVPRRIIEPVTLSDLRASPLSLGAKRPQATFETPDPKMARLAARARQDKDPGDLSPTSVQSPPDVIPVYANRKNAGQTTASHNPKLGKRGLLASPASTRGAGTRCDIAVDEAVGASAKYRYMYTPLEERAAAMEKGLLALQAQFESRFGLEGVAPVGVPRQEQIVTVGRIFCESAEGKINRASILLEGSRRDSGGQRVHLDLRELLSFAFFPGQVVAVQGVNSSGGRMVARRVIQGVPRPLPASPPAELMRFHHSTEFTGGKALSIFTAAGPFTATDSLVYDPLNDLLRVIAEAKPDVAILTGPFVDSEHPQVASGEASVEYADGGSDPVDFETLFKLRLSDKLQNLFRQNEDLPTQFVLVPSLRDVFHDFVYPQPPFHDRVAGGAKLHADTDAEESFFELNVPCVAGVRKRVHLAPNPAWLRVNEVTIGVTSTDTLKDLSGEEVSAEGTRGNRLARLAGHMLSQQSFYPLFPPPITSPAQLDMRHAQRWCMPTSPDVLLVPSKLAQFAREVQGCLCVNPGQLAKGTGGGTYAELSIHAIPREVLAKAQEELADKPEATIPHDVAKRACVEIRRI